VPVFRLSKEVVFPSPELAEPDGLLAIGGDLSPERLIEAYASGIFPWYSEGEPILWWSLDPRWLLEPAAVHVPRSLARTMRRGRYRFTADTAFRRVMERCAMAPRPDQDGTWVTSDMIEAYCRLHELGLAHSIEAWQGEELVGGLYGLSLGAAFFGESMFSSAPDASKACLVQLCRRLRAWDFDFIDCQMHTEHLERFGAAPVPRDEFLDRLGEALHSETRQGCWTLGTDEEGQSCEK